MSKTFDKPFLISVVVLLVFGFFIFSSASLGLLAYNSDKYSNVAFSQTFFGLFLGSLALIFTSRVPYTFWRKSSFFIFFISLALTAAVFVPNLGFEYAGARRWLLIGGMSFQPSELLKIGFIIYVAAWMTSVRGKITTVRYGLIPLFVILILVSVVLLNQPDTDVLAIIALSGFSIYLVAGGSWRKVIPIILIMILGIALTISLRPYVRERIKTFFNPKSNSLTSGYQIQQSLIAIGSGGVVGRGFGQSIQKFNFLPEPIGDSIFAVAGEEFGFLGTVFIVILFVFFAIRGLKIAAKTDDKFGRLLVVGIVILITAQAFLNMSAMLGVFPLTGNPLPFISHGGTALFFTLAEAGIILNVSRGQKKLA